VRTDTFRASGAGGQHINKTDSAVRLTHIPTGIVVQCQDGRSQHSNRDVAWKRLRSRLYDHEMRKRQEEQQKLEDTKTDVGWGHQIRSYVLDNSRIKDLRTNVENLSHAEGAGRRPRRVHRSFIEAGDLMRRTTGRTACACDDGPQPAEEAADRTRRKPSTGLCGEWLQARRRAGLPVGKPRLHLAGHLSGGLPAPRASARGARPAHCIVFEDAPFGIEAARRGGMRPWRSAPATPPRSSPARTCWRRCGFRRTV
jgi:hypothetical protein